MLSLCSHVVCPSLWRAGLLWAAACRPLTRWPLLSWSSGRSGLARGLRGVVLGLTCSTARGILPHQGPSPCLLHWQVDLLPPRYQGSPDVHFKHSSVCMLIPNSLVLPLFYGQLFSPRFAALKMIEVSKQQGHTAEHGESFPLSCNNP